MTSKWNEHNIKTRRPLMIEDAVNGIAEHPYNQYQTKKNIALLKELITPIFNASLIGYEFQDEWRKQTGAEQDAAIKRIFRITRTFKNITLTDDEYTMIANFAEAMRTVDTNNLEDIADKIENYITEDFIICSNPTDILYIMVIPDNIIEALLYFQLLPSTLSSATRLLAIPIIYKGYKIWSWATVPTGYDKYYMPELCAYWLYHKEDTPTVLSNPLVVLPEWYHSLDDNIRR